jgi:O-acetyl-ADP-ribose deacetylase (regulator of RNase III)
MVSRWVTRSRYNCHMADPATPPRIEMIEGDITEQDVDAIVNAANQSLLGGGGVDAAIHRAAGPALLEECRQLRATTLPDGLPVGSAVATGAGDLPARWVIHTVGPNRWDGETDPGLLAACFGSSLAEARRIGALSVAFPAISAGIFGWEITDVARIAASVVRDDQHVAQVELVRFVLHGASDHEAFRAAIG